MTPRDTYLLCLKWEHVVVREKITLRNACRKTALSTNERPGLFLARVRDPSSLGKPPETSHVLIATIGFVPSDGRM
jgi:hypothetical protein